MEWQQMETEENRKLHDLQIHATNQFDMSIRSVDVNPKFIFPFVMKFQIGKRPSYHYLISPFSFQGLLIPCWIGQPASTSQFST